MRNKQVLVPVYLIPSTRTNEQVLVI